MMLVAYMRDGRVHASHEAYEGGDGVASYQTSMDMDGNIEITTRINGHDYVSTWCWPADSKKPYGAVPLLRQDRRNTQ